MLKLIGGIFIVFFIAGILGIIDFSVCVSGKRHGCDIQTNKE